MVRSPQIQVSKYFLVVVLYFVKANLMLMHRFQHYCLERSALTFVVAETNVLIDATVVNVCNCKLFFSLKRGKVQAF